jgi:hypothetical protein
MQVTAAGAILTSLGWLFQLCKQLPAASKGRFAVVRVVAVAAAALAPVIACSVATATVLATSPAPNPYLGIERIERSAFASSIWLCVVCYSPFGGFFALCVSYVACVIVVEAVRCPVQFVYELLRPAFASMQSIIGGDTRSSDLERGETEARASGGSVTVQKSGGLHDKRKRDERKRDERKRDESNREDRRSRGGSKKETDTRDESNREDRRSRGGSKKETDTRHASRTESSSTDERKQKSRSQMPNEGRNRDKSEGRKRDNSDSLPVAETVVTAELAVAYR